MFISSFPLTLPSTFFCLSQPFFRANVSLRHFGLFHNQHYSIIPLIHGLFPSVFPPPAWTCWSAVSISVFPLGSDSAHPVSRPVYCHSILLCSRRASGGRPRGLSAPHTGAGCSLVEYFDLLCLQVFMLTQNS